MNEIKGWRVETCKGPKQGCVNRAAPDDALAADIDGVFRGHDFGVGLRALVGGALKHRHEFSVAIADCPNACSRPQIADLGLIGAAEPGFTNEACHQCMGCVHACREGAVAHPGLLPIINYERCVRCGTLLPGLSERHPPGRRAAAGGSSWAGSSGGTRASAASWPGSSARAGVLAAADCCIGFYLRNARAGERLGDLLQRVGDEELAACIRERAPQSTSEPQRKPAPILRGPV